MTTVEKEYTCKIDKKFEEIPFQHTAIRIVLDRDDYVQRIDIYPDGKTKFSAKKVLMKKESDDGLWTYKSSLEADDYKIIKKEFPEGEINNIDDRVDYVSFLHILDTKTNLKFRVSCVTKRVRCNKSKKYLDVKAEFEIDGGVDPFSNETFEQVKSVIDRFVNGDGDFRYLININEL